MTHTGTDDPNAPTIKMDSLVFDFEKSTNLKKIDKFEKVETESERDDTSPER